MNKLSFMVMLLTPDKTDGLGRHDFQAVPRIGEWVELPSGDKGTLYEVVKVAYKSGGSANVGDLYVRRLGALTESVKSLREKVT